MLSNGMDLLNWTLRFLVAKLRDRERLQRYGVVGNTLLFLCLCSGLFGLLFAAFGLVFARFRGEAAIQWALEGVLVGIAAAIVLMISCAIVEFD